MKDLKNWVRQQRRVARQIRIAGKLPVPTRELEAIKRKIWRKLFARFEKTPWVSAIAVDER